eukprot:scaffold49596_cov41-Prasinocladus_malaysianus.AAC.4
MPCAPLQHSAVPAARRSSSARPPVCPAAPRPPQRPLSASALPAPAPSSAPSGPPARPPALRPGPSRRPWLPRAPPARPPAPTGRPPGSR